MKKIKLILKHNILTNHMEAVSDHTKVNTWSKISLGIVFSAKWNRMEADLDYHS